MFYSLHCHICCLLCHFTYYPLIKFILNKQLSIHSICNKIYNHEKDFAESIIIQYKYMYCHLITVLGCLFLKLSPRPALNHDFNRLDNTGTMNMLTSICIFVNIELDYVCLTPLSTIFQLPVQCGYLCYCLRWPQYQNKTFKQQYALIAQLNEKNQAPNDYAFIVYTSSSRLNNHIGGVMVCLLTSSAVDRGFEP